MKVKTVRQKGSKRKLLQNIEMLAQSADAKTVFDGFSGTGIVSAHLRSKGYQVTANDLSASSYLYGKVFLEGYNKRVVENAVTHLNNLKPVRGWLTKNYSGEKIRLIRGTGGKKESRPLGFTPENAMMIDAARQWVEEASFGDERDRRAVVFSIVLAADRVFNNNGDQKSSLKMWTTAALKKIKFKAPTLIEGPTGTQLQGDILNTKLVADLVYLDPPYTRGVLYPACYHLNDSIAMWDKPLLDYSYAIPRPERVCFRKRGQVAGGFYNKGTAVDSFRKLLNNCEAKMVVLSYSDAPRNVLSFEQLMDICGEFGETSVLTKEHAICTQFSSMNKISDSLKEFFIKINLGTIVKEVR